MNIAITGGDALTDALARAEALQRAREAERRNAELAALCEEVIADLSQTEDAEWRPEMIQAVAAYRARLAALREG